MIEIYFSKTKYFFILLGCVAFVAMLLWMISTGANDTSIKASLATIGGLAFFGIGTVICAYICFGPAKIGLCIDRNGITMFSGLSRSNDITITWGDIKEFSEISISGAKMIAIMLYNPEKHIASLSGSIRQQAARFSMNQAGTPYALTAGAYKIYYAKLLETLTKSLKDYSTRPKSSRTTNK